MAVRRGLRGGLAVMVAAVLGVVGGAAAFGAGAVSTPSPTQASPTVASAQPSPSRTSSTPTPTTTASTSAVPPRMAAPAADAADAADAAAAAADARVTLTADGEVAPGGRLRIEAYADLVSGSAPAVVLEVDLPTGVTYVPADPHTSVGQFCRATGQLVTCRDEQPDIGGGTTAGGFLLLEAGRDVAVGTLLRVVARASVEGASDPEPGNDVAAGAVRVVEERNVALSWGSAQYSTRSAAKLVLALTVVNQGDAPVETLVTVTDPTYADGTPGVSPTVVSGPPDQPEGSCFADAGAIYCSLTLAGGQQKELEYGVRVDPADAGHTLAVRASSRSGSVDATATDNVSVTRITVAKPATSAYSPPPTTGPPASPSDTELAATGPDQRTPLLIVLGLLLVTSGVAALRYSTR